MTWLRAVAVGLDDFAAAIFFNRNDLTISAMCHIVRAGTAAQLAWLRPSYLQQYALHAIGAALDFVFPGHCAAAFAADLARAQSVRSIP